ncbi:MAG TPA: hypothetical protein PLZ36_13155 [Armatimonadota bacterium]|nr:hypothetical protein [Armatimonadota bacterium]HOS42650.1 hypothetical protein [Armatimonadota bacterium]
MAVMTLLEIVLLLAILAVAGLLLYRLLTHRPAPLRAGQVLLSRRY